MRRGEHNPMPHIAGEADRDHVVGPVLGCLLHIGHRDDVVAAPGQRVLLVDDLTTDGTSKLAFVRGLRSAGAIVEHALTIFFNDAFPGAMERLSQARIALHPLATWAPLLLADSGLAAEDRATIENFLKDPVAWSARHGGRIAPTPRVGA